MCTGRMTTMTLFDRRLLENPHLLRYPHPASLRRTSMYASLLGICPQKTRTPHPSGGSPVSDALYLGIFQKPPAEQLVKKVLWGSVLSMAYEKSPVSW
jgi:hypothetical protein